MVDRYLVLPFQRKVLSFKGWLPNFMDWVPNMESPYLFLVSMKARLIIWDSF